MADPGTIRDAEASDTASILAIVNDAAVAYRGVIAPDCWHDPYMSEDELRREMAHGVRFWIHELDGAPAAVMGLQIVREVALIRHAYVHSGCQRSGLGSSLLRHLRSRTDRPMLVGTWRAASWAVSFYERHGFRMLGNHDARRLLLRYWEVPERQIQESVVLAGPRWKNADAGLGTHRAP